MFKLTGPWGNCPVQATGKFLGKYFYFRARWDKATIEFAENEEMWEKDIILKRYILLKTEPFKAGWLSKIKCFLLIIKGCYWYLINKDENNTTKHS